MLERQARVRTGCDGAYARAGQGGSCWGVQALRDAACSDTGALAAGVLAQSFELDSVLRLRAGWQHERRRSTATHFPARRLRGGQALNTSVSAQAGTGTGFIHRALDSIWFSALQCV